ncbi:ABC transporter ATP-binding protein [Amycolatopsis sp. SID8362]|uniref:ABC transporter ATP-binding protein n=1 Tax=Amycolatopsis sp. SID8362 TaxID=2690346 RepID=UPI00136AFA89|nr:ABC transporter ATP-binding protein [Amycolatopsis sp. SID8362]NBH12394.1 ATP-binding cassette domain-containing protein [Amycolatopsis sp. SID8362]NED49086.1 ABC transporter ATP-binding protein [Amycolatopsis sp. SID8362]
MAEVRCELSGVRKQYGGRRVLDGFGLRVEAGEFVALTGASGMGKSTVLNLIGLLDAPDSGAVRLLGRAAPGPHSRAANRLRRSSLGYLFQNFALIDSDTVAQNLGIALTYAGRGTPKRERIAEALAQVGLPGAEDRRIFSLSGGEQQRVAVARLLLKPCDIVLADEPTGSLDSENRDVVLGLLRRLNEAGKTIVVATHDEAVAGACSRVVEVSG